jgi:hypothetical protein
MNGKIYVCGALLLSTLLGAQQPVPATSESVIVTESRHGIVCDTRCTITQQITATVGDRKLELRLYENKPESLLALGTYPGQRELHSDLSGWKGGEIRGNWHFAIAVPLRLGTGRGMATIRYKVGRLV